MSASVTDFDPANDIFDLEDLTNEALLKLVRNAYIDAEIAEGSVHVLDDRKFWMSPNLDRKYISFAVYYTFRPNVAAADKLEYVNSINDSLALIRAAVSLSSGNLVLDWYISVDGGVTRRSIVRAMKRFVEYVGFAVAKDAKDIVG